MTATTVTSWQHHFVETNRIRLHCVTQGEGELVLLLHGFPEFWYSWRHQIPVLSRHFKVVVPDLRGFNDSDKPTSGYDLDTLVADVRGLIEELGYKKAHIVGHDWGGAIAWHFAHKFPYALDRLAILNAPHPQDFMQAIAGSIDQLRRNWYVLASQIPALPEWLIRQNLGAILRNMFQSNTIRKGAFTTRDTEIYQAALEKPGVLKAVIHYYRTMMLPQISWRLWDRSPNPIQSPTLILWGEEDQLLTPQLTDSIPTQVNAPYELRMIPECGHWVHQETPQTVNRELLEFLRSANPNLPV
ncbi:MAG: alpha/beta hydrolase [Cyanobacteria bacterium J06638_20]